MKVFVGVACIVITFLCCISIPHNNETKTALKFQAYYYLPGEDSLNVNADTLHISSGNNRFTLKDTCLYVVVSGKLSSIDSLNDLVDTIYMRNLYDTASAKNSGVHNVTALQIKYGLHNHKVKLYYKALSLDRDSTTKPGVTPKLGYYSNHHPFDSNYYCYTGSGFMRAPYKNQFLKDSLNYIDSIRIRHHLNNPTPGYFYTANNDTGDVHSVIFSFQEVYSLIKNNSGSRYVKVSSIGQRVKMSITLSFYKHSIMLGPNSLQPGGHGTGGGSGVYYNVYADLAGMCPPQCSELQFQLK